MVHTLSMVVWWFVSRPESEGTVAQRMRVVVGEGRRRDESSTLKMLAFASGILTFLLLIGTLFDLPISQAIAIAEGSPLVTIVSTMGMLPLMCPLCAMAGACIQRLRNSRRKSTLSLAGAFICLAIVFASGCIGFTELFGSEGLGPILPFAMPEAVSMVGGISCSLALAGIGYIGAEDNSDPALIRRLALIVGTLVALYVLVLATQHLMCRPRYRLVRQGLSGVEYNPWYVRNTDADQLTKGLGIETDEFRSFPSNTVLQCASLVAAYYGLMAIFPRLRSGWGIVRVAYIPYFLVVMLSNIMLGAHFLSDAAMAGLAAVVATICLLRAEVRIPVAPARSYLRQV